MLYTFKFLKNRGRIFSLLTETRISGAPPEKLAYLYLAYSHCDVTDHLSILNWPPGSSDADLQTIAAGAENLMHRTVIMCQALS